MFLFLLNIVCVVCTIVNNSCIHAHICLCTVNPAQTTYLAHNAIHNMMMMNIPQSILFILKQHRETTKLSKKHVDALIDKNIYTFNTKHYGNS